MTAPDSGLERLARALVNAYFRGLAQVDPGDRAAVRAILTALRTETETNEGMVRAGYLKLKSVAARAEQLAEVRAIFTAMIDHLLGDPT